MMEQPMREIPRIDQISTGLQFLKRLEIRRLRYSWNKISVTKQDEDNIKYQDKYKLKHHAIYTIQKYFHKMKRAGLNHWRNTVSEQSLLEIIPRVRLYIN